MALGERIRQRRQQMDMSLQELANRTGLTASFLSQVERDVTEPSITSLRRIAGALDVPVFFFLLDDSTPSPLVRKHERRILRLHDTDAQWELLSPADPNSQLEVVLTRLPAGVASGQEHTSHPGEESFVVLEGEMEIDVADETYHLYEGDAIQIRATLPHRIRNGGAKELVVLAAITPPRF
ncbi:MAG TPA: cupin domain-containing protein [Symbiobacteriaceae bacterium]|nr:cupin domain-containing protein [Symbiobacteriaceae bacterium]